MYRMRRVANVIEMYLLSVHIGAYHMTVKCTDWSEDVL